MTKMLTTRLDDDTETALDRLVEETGKNASQLVRDLILDAQRASLNEQIRAEAAAIMADPEQVAEIAEVQRIMEPLRAW